MNADQLDFLDFDDVLELQTAQLGVFGGGSGLRDRALLESAVAQPQAAFGRQYAHDGLFSMAAACLFHVVSNHPFVDGNKRVGLPAALIFLDLNDITLLRPSDALYALTMGGGRGAHRQGHDLRRAPAHRQSGRLNCDGRFRMSPLGTGASPEWP